MRLLLGLGVRASAEALDSGPMSPQFASEFWPSIPIVMGMGSHVFLFICLTPIISLTTTDYSAQQNNLAFAVEKYSDC